MRKRFKKRKNYYALKLIIYILFIMIGFFSSIKVILTFINKKIDQKQYIKYLLNTGFKNQINYDGLIIDNITSNTFNVFNNDSDDAIVYIYNTHDIEEYAADIVNPYNIMPNVKLASYYLQERLKDLGINSIVEERSVYKKLKDDGRVYKYSYEVSKEYLVDSYNKNQNLKYFIDLHRDSSSKDKTTITLDGINYARVLFILGTENLNYENNLLLINKINDYLNSNYKGISRGIYRKSGPGVNGIYNQDFSSNTILIEIGGVYNYIGEVSNTIDIISKALYEVIELEKEE